MIFQMTIHGEVHSKIICESFPVQDYSLVEKYSNQNDLRRSLSILNKVRFHPESRISLLPDWCDIYISHESNQYGLWVYTRNWHSRAGFLAGALVGWRSKRARRISRNRRAH